MQGTWHSLLSRLLVTVLASLVVFAVASPFMATTAYGATSTSFSPTSVNLTTGQSTTITIAAVGLAAGATGAQFGIVHNKANTTITNAACVGLFAGANVNQAAQSSGDLIACTFASGGASGSTGNVMTFTLTNTGGGNETISFNATSTFYLTAAFATDPAGTLNTLTVTGTAAASTPMPTATIVPISTLTAIPVAVSTVPPMASATTSIAAPVAPPTLARTATPVSPIAPTNLAPPPPNSGTLVVCTSITVAGTAAATFTFTPPPGGPTISTITVPAGQVGPVCAAGVAVAAGTVAVTEVVPAGSTLQSVTGGTLAGNTATATIAPGQTTSLTFINDPTTAILPTPQVQFLPLPPPPPPLPAAAPLPPSAAPPLPAAPPPAAAPPITAAAPPITAAAPTAPGAPIIPESDSLALLAIGLATLGGLAVLRRR